MTLRARISLYDEPFWSNVLGKVENYWKFYFVPKVTLAAMEETANEKYEPLLIFIVFGIVTTLLHV
jgi:hypothetical protein